MPNASFMTVNQNKAKLPAPDPANQYGGGMTTTMGMPQGPPNQQPTYGVQAQQNQYANQGKGSTTQPGYQAGDVASYLKQNAMTPGGQPNTNPAPYGLPNYADYMKSAVGTSGNMPGIIQRPPGTDTNPDGGQKPWWDPYNADTWNNDDARKALTSYMENLGFPQAQMQQTAQQNAFQNWMGIQNLGGQQAMNAFNMGITGRQTGLQEWAAQQAAQQAQAQFGLDQNLANWRYGAGGLEERNLNNQRYATDQERVRQNMIGNQALAQIGARSQGEQALQQMIGGQQMGQIGARGTQERMTQQVVNRGMQAQQKLINQGNLSVQEQRDLAEMQRLQGSVNSIQFGQQQLGEQSRASRAQEALKYQQNQNELMAARYAAFGRQQQPNATWRGNFG